MKHDMIFSRKPASLFRGQWREGFPSGNGVTGVSVYGGAGRETVLINRGDLWTGIRRGAYPDVAEILPKMRALAESGKYAEANGMLAGALAERGYSSSAGTPLPLGQLNLETEMSGMFSDYIRSIDLSTGEVSVSFSESGKKHRRRAFVSRARGSAVLEIGCSSPSDYAISLGLRDDGESECKCPESIRDSFERSVLTDGRTEIFFRARNTDGKWFGANCRIVTDGRACGGEPLKISGATTILLVIETFANRSKRDSEVDSKSSSRAAAMPRTGCSDGVGSPEIGPQPDYEALLSDHVPLHWAQYGSVEFSLCGGNRKSNEELLYDAYRGKVPAELFEKLWKFGRYLFVSATCKEGLPCAQYGLWVGEYGAQWSQNVLNENLEMMYWQTLKGNLDDACLAVFRYFESMLPDYREGAKKLFGCRGIYIHGYSCPGMGQVCVNVPIITNWTGAAGWIAQLFFDYWKYSGDFEFLRDRALPFLFEVCLFYRDFLTEDSAGKWSFYPSVSPENSPGNFVREGFETLSHPMPTAVNATMDVAIAREVFSNMLEGIRLSGRFSDYREEFSNLLSRLPDYTVGEDGALDEWIGREFSPNNLHRHLSHLYPLFPGSEIDASHPLFEACRRAVENRVSIGLRHQSGWSFVHLANVFARLGDAGRVEECLTSFIRTNLSENLFATHNDWRGMGCSIDNPANAPVQLDANMGYVSAVLEMLVGSKGNRLDLLPALPKDWTRGSIKNIRFEKGRLSLRWNRTNGTLHAEISGADLSTLDIGVPEEFSHAEILSAGKSLNH